MLINTYKKAVGIVLNSTKFPRIDIYETMKYWMIIVQISTLTERTQKLQSHC